jgi:hypothetical protein
MSLKTIQKIDAVVVILVIVLLAAAGLGGLALWQEQTLASLASPTPQKITLQQLIDNGPGDNIHVTVTQLQFGLDWVYEEKNQRWERVWIPIYPDRNAELRKEFHVIVRTSDTPDEDTANQFCQQTELTGLIVNSIHQLRSPEIIVLEQGFPNIDASQILVLDTSRKLSSPRALALLWQLTLSLPFAAIVIALTWLIIRRWQSQNIPPPTTTASSG